ncbi:acyl-CoA dehydrogenase family protein [Cupriavidus numazuensis]|uniref:Acyl-CoA dehydrogenase n=1 Tax=Cupriavidus numazuensis TaxID=221992 RepID=A0ABM8TJR9_9BURK|nr:acyl-CoA dehydrogenase family protein [Cupriavidus numazuensis]CAG2150309.1 Acyl-CoA dehydrogenase [Cupriavidus numazuensis]
MQRLTEERRMIQEAARQFTMERVLPIANKLDPEKGQIPRELIDEMAELGYFGILIPEEYGGLGLGAYEYCLVAEQLSRGWMSVGSLIARGNGLIGALKGLSPERKAEYLPRMARGEFLGAFSLSEPNAGSDVANISCRAVRDGDDWLITGNKYWCTFADEADFILVICRTDPVIDPKARHKGLSAFMVEKPRGELPEGVKGSVIPKIGYHGWTTWELAFDGCRVPHSKMVGEEGKAFYLTTAGLETARAHTAARSIGLAQGSLEDSIQYAKDRNQFGNPIGNFQAIRFKLADMATQIEASRALLYTVCEKIDEGVRADTEASMVKLFASEMCERVTSEGLQIHGGAGYTTHFAAERYWRDARLTKIFEGTSEIQMRIISDAMLGKIAA